MSRRYLEAARLVQTLGYRGSVVAELIVAETLQIYEIRNALESLAVRACAKKHDSQIIELLGTRLPIFAKLTGRQRSLPRPQHFTRFCLETEILVHGRR